MSEHEVARPRLPVGVRLRFDGVREKHFLLYPEGALGLNETAAAVLELCDGIRTIDDIAAVLSVRYEADVHADVQDLLRAIAAKGLVEDVG
jgi:pyrroloquinoline quinone biosynthesis protein D